MSELTSYTAAELQHLTASPPLARIEGDGIVIDLGYEYRIDLDRIDTQAKVLAWVVHLAGKGPVTAEMLGDLVLVACHHHGLFIDHDC